MEIYLFLNIFIITSLSKLFLKSSEIPLNDKLKQQHNIKSTFS